MLLPHRYPTLFVLALSAALLASTMRPVPAAEIEFGGVLPGGTVVRKRVMSMREMRYVKLVPQETDFSCGAASLATILKYGYGMDVSERDVIAGLMKVSDPKVAEAKGFSMLNIKNYLETIGMRGKGYRVDPELLVNVKVPTIALLDIKGYKHFVVLKKTTEDKMYVADPALGNKILWRDEFLKAWSWSGVIFAVLGKGFDKDSVLLRPQEPLTARPLFAEQRRLRNADLLDFGFAHSELF